MYDNNIISFYLYSKTPKTIRKALIIDKIASNEYTMKIINQYGKYKQEKTKEQIQK